MRTVVLLAALLVTAQCGLAQTPAVGAREDLVLSSQSKQSGFSEGDFITLRDGRILFVYSHFTGGQRDGSPSFLASRVSPDGGMTWSSEDRTAVASDRDAVPTVSSVSLLRLKDRRIALFYVARKSDTDRRFVMRISNDEGNTWGDPTVCTPGPGYFLVTNGRVIRLGSGRILFPAAKHELPEDPKGDHRGIATCFYSDDEGATWKESDTPLQAPANSHSGFQYPAVVELKDHRLMMLMAMHLRPLLRSYSSDGGRTWSTPASTELASPISPPAICRLPSTADLLLLWNDHHNTSPVLKNSRTPLVAAISKDDGRTWPIRKQIYSDPEGSFQFPAISFTGNRVLVSLCAATHARGMAAMARLVICSFPVDWLYN